MALLDILTAPNPHLHRKARPVEKVDTGTQKLMDDLLETLYAHGAIGLASVQVGMLQRVIVIDLGERHTCSIKPLFMANPEITYASQALQMTTEACLSVPNFTGNITRPLEVQVSYLDENNVQKTLTAEGLLADCIQHEIDHLNGVLYIQHLSSLRRNLILSKLTKTKRNRR